MYYICLNSLLLVIGFVVGEDLFKYLMNDKMCRSVVSNNKV